MKGYIELHDGTFAQANALITNPDQTKTVQLRDGRYLGVAADGTDLFDIMPRDAQNFEAWLVDGPALAYNPNGGHPFPSYLRIWRASPLE